MPGVEGRDGFNLAADFGLVSVSQSHEGADNTAFGSVVADHLPESNSVDIGVGAVAVFSEEGVLSTDSDGSVEVVPVVFPGKFVEEGALGVSEVGHRNFLVVDSSGPVPTPVRFLVFGPSGDGVDSVAKIQGDGEGSHVEGFEVVVLEVDAVSKSAEADVGDFSGGGSIPGDGIEGAEVVPVLVDEEVTVVVGDVGHVGEGGRGEVVPVLVPQFNVDLIAAGGGVQDNPLDGPRGVPDGVDR